MDSCTYEPVVTSFEEPDVFHWHVRGTVDEDHIKEAGQIARELCAKRGIRVFFVVHIEFETSGADSLVTAAARKYVAAEMFDWKATIVVGGNPAMRAAAQVLARAHSLLRPTTVPNMAVKSMDEAREFMDQIREKEAAGPPPAGEGRGLR